MCRYRKPANKGNSGGHDRCSEMSSDSSSSSESDDSRTQSSDSNGIREVNGNQPTHVTFPEVPGFSNALDTYVYQNTAPGPRYRRGRGRSFFKDSPVGKNSCQGGCLGEVVSSCPAVLANGYGTAMCCFSSTVKSIDVFIHYTYTFILILQCLGAFGPSTT
jgi:hypothetical protein